MKEVDVYQVVELNRETGVEYIVGVFPQEPSKSTIASLPTHCPHELQHKCKRFIRHSKQYIGST